MAVDLGYKVTAGLLFGYAAGWALSHAAIWIRRRVRGEMASDEMLTLGFISLVYGAALAIDTYAFLSVFAAALAMRQVELKDNDGSADEAVQEADQSDAEHEADAPEHATAMLTRDNLVVADTMERLVQIVLVVMVGVLAISRTSHQLARSGCFGGRHGAAGSPRNGRRDALDQHHLIHSKDPNCLVWRPRHWHVLLPRPRIGLRCWRPGHQPVASR